MVLETTALPLELGMYVEEDVGFEPTDVLPPSVFKTDTISRSVNLPYVRADGVKPPELLNNRVTTCPAIPTV